MVYAPLEQHHSYLGAHGMVWMCMQAGWWSWRSRQRLAARSQYSEMRKTMFHLLKKGVAAWKDADDALDDEGTVGCPSAQCSLTVPLTNCELPVLDGYKGSKSFPMQFTNTW
ncbi:hypothetical protein CIHG_04706 [Coccidioides immitis H538.4]|uniref:Uncharacterized protein n=3 Tax=Coccidioides immitis TaxID=5501 RepID=A0A0J8TF94_COCIT|nr:hypothetical protein CIRG_08126 [Coccidioides immitis RMSCC 2394]KMU72297.1 hypothetical protein CISG_02946 [Coccidioides immitis RMSCC 3703]KMU87261.1 hypothetical protein CIHG_04706 [Coccidioides immitis H538.4]